MTGKWLKRAGMFLPLAVLMGALQWNWFAMPLERDEGEYAYSAWLMLSGKGVPYQDSFLQKPPMIVHTYALVEALAPKSDKVGFRVAGFLASLATAGLVWKLGKREFGGRSGLWAAWLWMAFAQQMMFAPVAANAEKFMVVPMLGAMLSTGAGERRWWRWCLAGALAAAAVLYKPICAPVLGVHFLWRGAGRSRDEWRNAWRWWGAALAGGIVAAGAALWWFARKGALGAMWECTVEFTGAYAELTRHPLHNATVWATSVGTWKLGLAGGLAALGMALRWRDGWKWTGVFALATFVSMTGVNGHYYFLALPFAAMLAGAGVEKLSGFPERRQAWLGAVTVAVLVVALLGNGKEWWGLKLRPQRLCWALYDGNPFPEAMGAGTAAAALCGEDGTVYVAGSEPEIMWYARRKGATRFDIFYPLSLPTKYAAGYQAEAKAELAVNPPEVVVAAETILGIGRGLEAVYGEYWNWLADMVERGGYRLEWAFVPSAGGWVQGGEWKERKAEGATLGVFAKPPRDAPM